MSQKWILNCSRAIGLVCILSLLPAIASAQDAELIVEVDRQQIYLGESIVYNVTVNHVENPQQPRLEGFDAFDVDLQGQQPLDSQQITIINGRRTEIIRRGMLYQFRLLPKSAGSLTIPAPTAEADGDVLTGKSIPIEVIAPEEQDIVILESSVDRDSVYPLQPFTMSLTVAIRELPDPISARSPLSIQPRDPVKLTVPWLDDQQIPDGLTPENSWREILEPLVSGSTRRQSDGMQINDIGSQSAFSFFERNRKTVFLPPSTRTTRTTTDGDTVGYVEYTLTRTFVPEKLGEFQLAAGSMKGTFGTELTGENLTGDEIYAVSKPLKVTVKDVPADGRPDEYVGAIGTFVVSASLLPGTASVGTPLTLTVSISGEGTIADIRPPDISAIPSVSEQFRTYDATEKTVQNGRMFTYSLRALSEDVTDFPGIPVAYFDVNKEEYVSLKTDPIPLTITAAQKLAASDIVASESAGSNGAGLRVNDSGLFANHSSLQNLRATTVPVSRWVTVWLVMVVGYFGLSFGLQRRQKFHADPALRKRREAKKRALKSLTTARAAAADSSQSVSVDALTGIVAGLIADFTGTSEAGMTSVDATNALRNVSCDQNLQDRVGKLMAVGDAARFGADSGDTSELDRECESLIEDLSRELSKRC